MNPLLFLLLVALVVVLRRAFVRLDELHRSTASLRERIAQLERERVPGVPRSDFKTPAPVARGFSPASSSPEQAGLKACATPEEAGLKACATTVPEPQGDSCVPVAQGFSPASPSDTEHESLETQIGTQWLLYIGVIAIVIGVAYFEKLAIDNRWIGETARVIQGAVLGFVLTYAGLRFARAGYALYGQMITGGGAAILYLSTYAAFNFYHLIDRPAAFALMIGITVMVAWLADRQQSQGLALFAVGGGFGTPFLLPGTTDAQIALFGYDAILIGGTVLLSRRRDWPVLNIVSYVFTLLTVAAWADRFYTSAKFLRTELFITLFCAMFLSILRQSHRSEKARAGVAALVLWTAPAVYYAASIAILMDHPTAILVWLVALMLTGGILSSAISPVVGLAIWGAVTLPLLAWIQAHMGTSAWLVPGLATVAGVYVIALAAQLYSAFERDEFGAVDILWLHLNGLMMFAGAYFLIAEIHTAVTGTFAAAFGLWHWALAAIVVKGRRDHALHFAALGFTLLSIAIALQFDGPAITIGWACEGAVIVALGLRERRDWLRTAGSLLFAVAVWRTVALLASVAPRGDVVFLNLRAVCALVVAALSYLLAWLHHRDTEAPNRDLAIGAGLIAAQVVVLALLTSEIHTYWALREWSFERQLVTSVTWGLYATVLIVIGLRKRYAPIRYFAILVFGITIVKVFAVDMAELDRIYRVASVIGLGVLLLVTSYLYTRSRRA